jgi:autotransporter-associated beta strand protein
VTSGAALQIQGDITTAAEALTLNGTGVSATGALRNISGNNSYAGLVSLASATRINSDAGTLTLSHTGTITGSGLGLSVGGAGNTTIASIIGTGTGTLTKDAAGTLTLSGANTYSGLTTVSAGVLNIQNATALGTTAAGTTVTSGAALQIQGDITTAAEALTLNGTGVSATGALRNISGNNSYAGLVTLASAARINSDAGTLTLSNTGTITGSGLGLSVGGAGNTTIASIIGTGTGTLTKDGVGTLTLTRANTYTGATTVSSGTLDLNGAAGALTATNGVNINGGTLLLSGSATDRISNTASVTLGAETDSQLQLSGSVTETLGAVTLSSGVGKRVIDFGAGSGVLRLASLTAASPLSVQIWNWSGTTGTGGGTDQLIISSGSLGGSLSTSDISFYSDSGISLLTGATIFNATSRELLTETPVPPTIAISSNVSTLKAGETATLSFTLSVASTNFSSADVSATGGTLSNFSGSGTAYTATFTPTANSTANGVISVASGTFSNAAGSTNQDGADADNSVTLTVNTLRPSIAISSNVSTLKAGETASLSFTLSEASPDFSSADVSAIGGTLSNFSGSGTAYTATFTPTANSNANGVISVASSTFSNAAGNTNNDGADANNTVTLTVDTLRPTIAISSNVSILKAGETATLSFTLSEASSDFSSADVSAIGGILSNFSGSGTAYTATFTPTANSNANGVISVASSTFFDVAGNTNIDGADANNTFTLTVDTAVPNAPLISTITDDVAPITGTVASGGSTNDTVLVIAGTAEANSTVTVYNGSTSLGTTSANGSGAWTFTTATLFNGSTYSFNATATDGAGNGSAASANYTVTVDTATVDTAAPTLLSSTPADGATDAGVSNNLVLNFSETIAAGSGLISLYRANGSLVESFDGATGIGSAGGSVAFSGSAVTINPFADLVRGSAYYLQVAASAIRDSAGNLYAGISDATTLNFNTAAVTVSVGSITVSESSLYAVVAVGLDAAISDNLSFTPTLLSGTASIGSDAGSTLQVFNGASWVSAAAGVSLAAGSTSLLLRVAINNDTSLEGLETFQISTGAISGGGSGALTNASGASGTVTIADDGSSAQIFDQDTNSAAPLLRSTDNDTPSIAVSSVIVSEASPYAVLELSLTNPSNFAVSFTPSLQSGSATIGADTGSTLEVFNGSTWQAAGQLSLAAGVTSRLVRVAIANDSGYENSETFTISTGAISGPIANPAGASGTVTIRDNGSSSNTFLANNNSATPTAGSADNDTPALPALSAAVLGNGNESGTVATNFRISRTGDTSSAMVATYRFAGTAIAGSDYTNPAGFDASTGLGSVTILAGQSSVDLSVPTLNDSAVDGNRSLSLLLQSSLTYTIAAATATATILDNDVAPPLTPTFAITSASVVETDLGSNPIVNLIVSLSGPAATSVSVRVRTLAALSGSSATGTSASGGGDYVAISDQLLTFLPGSTSQQLPIQLLGDNTVEATESFRIELFNASGANLPAATATIEIVDNDSGKSLTINNSAATTSQTFSGGQYADILIGGSAADTINGDPAGQIGGGDAITGNGGADILTGGPGADRFRYTVFSDSTLSSTDRIRDLTLTGNDQDRIALAALPSALWNTGVIRPTSATLANAVAAAFADKDGLTAGNQALAAGEAVLFAYDSTPGNSRTRQWFVAVNDSSAAFSSSNDLLINVTGLSSSFASGSLTPSLLFATT